MKHYFSFIVLTLVEIILANNNENLNKNQIKRQTDEVPFSETNPTDLIKLKNQNTTDLIEIQTYTRLKIPKNSIGVLMLNNLPLYGKDIDNLTTHTNFKLNNLEYNPTNSIQTKLNSNSMKSQSDISSLLKLTDSLPSSLQLSPSTSLPSSLLSLSPSLSDTNPNYYLDNYFRNYPPLSKPLSSFLPFNTYENNYYKNSPYWFKPNSNIPKPTKPSPLHLLIEKLNESKLQNDTESTESENDNSYIDDNSMEMNNDDNHITKRIQTPDIYNKNYQYILPTVQPNDYNDYQWDFDNFDLYNSRNNLLRKSFDTTNPYIIRKYLPSVLPNNINHNNNQFSIPSSSLPQLPQTSRMQSDLSSYTNKLNPFNIRSTYGYLSPPPTKSQFNSRQYPWQYYNKPLQANLPSAASFTPSSGSYLKYPTYMNQFKLNNERRDFPLNYVRGFPQEPSMNNLGHGSGSPLISDLKNSLKELKSKISQIRQYMENKMHLQEESI